MCPTGAVRSLTPENAGWVGFDLVQRFGQRAGVEVVVAVPAAVAVGPFLRTHWTGWRSLPTMRKQGSTMYKYRDDGPGEPPRDGLGASGGGGAAVTSP